MTFQLIDLFLFPAFGQGFIMAFLLRRLPSNFPHINRSLATFLVLASVLIIGRVILVRWVSSPYDYFWILANSALFLFGPLFYQFSRRITHDQKYTLTWPHRLPIAIHLFLVIFLLTVGWPWLEMAREQGTVWYLYATLEGAGLLLNLGYWIVSVRRIRNAYQQHNVVVFQGRRSRQFLRFTVGLLGLALVAWCISFVACWVFRSPTYYLSANIQWFCLAGFIYIMGVYILIIQRINNDLERALVHLRGAFLQISPNRVRLSPARCQMLASKLDYQMQKNELFRDESLTQKRLAETLGTSVQDLSWVLNHHYKQSFFDYINQLRIQAFLSRIEAGEHQKKTLLALALEAGFKSKSTFNRVFKEQHHCSPSQYIAKLAS
ncbi:MAG: helix-turn-helix domain-containing protein [Bacteroidota bacterium]